MNYETAVGNLKKYFGNNQSDYVTMEEIYRNAGRGEYDLKANRTWSHGKFSAMKPHNLFKTEKAVENGVYVTAGIRLTEEGREALSRGIAQSIARQPSSGATHAQSLNQPTDHQVSLNSIFSDVETLRAQSPNFDIEFTLSIKSKELPVK